MGVLSGCQPVCGAGVQKELSAFKWAAENRGGPKTKVAPGQRRILTRSTSNPPGASPAASGSRALTKQEQEAEQPQGLQNHPAAPPRGRGAGAGGVVLLSIPPPSTLQPARCFWGDVRVVKEAVLC